MVSGAKAQIEAHRFASFKMVVVPHVGVVCIFKTEAEPEASGGEGPSLNILFPIADAREVARWLSSSTDDAEAGYRPGRA
jgi:hypothetical protein